MAFRRSRRVRLATVLEKFPNHVAPLAHPSFVEIIRQLDSLDAKILAHASPDGPVKLSRTSIADEYGTIDDVENRRDFVTSNPSLSVPSRDADL